MEQEKEPSEESKLTLLKRNRALRVLGWAFITVLLGAVGSGLWELFLSRIFEAGSNIFLSTISSLFHGYVDVLHRNIGKAQPDQMIVLPYLLFLLGIIFLPWIYIWWGFRLLNQAQGAINSTSNPHKVSFNIERINTKMRSRRNLIIRFFVPMGIIISLLYTSQGLEDSYNRRACIYIDRSIEILAPYIAQEQLLQLRAAYRSVDNAQKFYELDSQLKAIALENNVEIPKFTVIR